MNNYNKWEKYIQWLNNKNKKYINHMCDNKYDNKFILKQIWLKNEPPLLLHSNYTYKINNIENSDLMGIEQGNNYNNDILNNNDISYNNKSIILTIENCSYYSFFQYKNNFTKI